MKILVSFLLALLWTQVAQAQLPELVQSYPGKNDVVPGGECWFKWELPAGRTAWLQIHRRVNAQWVVELDAITPPDTIRLRHFLAPESEYRWRACLGGLVGNFGDWWPFVTTKLVLDVSVRDDLPASFHLEQNYPNPFNPTTTIRFELTARTPVHLTVYDALGRQVATLVNETPELVVHETTWNAANMPSGVYFYRLTTGPPAGGFVQTKKMVLLR